MSRTIAGSMNWGSWGSQLSTEDIAVLISDCVEAGITTFDHADIYGGYSTEADWGKAWNTLSIPRENIQVISKCGICYPCDNRPQYTIKHYDYSYNHILQSVDNSLKNLQIDYLDTLLLHRPSPLLHPEEVAKAFAYLSESGKVRHIGVSNFTIPQMESLRKYLPISANQIELSLLHHHPLTDGTIDYCMQHGIEVQAWSPLGGGQLFKESADYDFVLRRDRLKQVADQYKWGLDEMSYIFLLHHPAGIRPVTGSAKINRITTALKQEDREISDVQWFEIYTASIGKKVA